MFDLKVINSVLSELEEVRVIPRASIIDAIEAALATAYKKEYGKRGQIIRTTFDINTGQTEFYQVKIVVDGTRVIFDESEEVPAEDLREYYNPEKHILIEDARKMKKWSSLSNRREITAALPRRPPSRSSCRKSARRRRPLSSPNSVNEKAR